MNLFDSNNPELRSQLRSAKPKTRESLDVVHKRFLKKLARDTYVGVKQKDVGVKNWWTFGYKGEKEQIYGPFFTAGEANRKLSDYDDGEFFELTNIMVKSDAKKAIKKILQDRLDTEQELLRKRLHE